MIKAIMRALVRALSGLGVAHASAPFLAIASLSACASAPQRNIAPRPDAAIPRPQALAGGEFVSSAEAMRAHIAFLADDLLQGRKPGTPGYDIAAGYVASQFALLGVAPAGEAGSYRQPVPLVRYKAAGRPRLSVRRPGARAVDLVEGQDFGFRGWPIRPEISLTAPLVFAGYGIVAPELGRDDFAGLDIAGKVVVVLDGAPVDMAVESVDRHGSGASKREAAGKRGAIGVVLVLSLLVDGQTPAPAAATASGGKGVAPVKVTPPRTVSMTWRVPGGEAYFRGGGVVPVARVDRSGAAKLLAGAPVGMERLHAAANAPGGKVPTFALPGTIRADLRTDVEEIASFNVAGMIEGGDPVLRDEVVVLTAHLDHIGIQPAVGGDAIGNGALDNASGVATLLEVARGFREAGTRPRRSVMLLALTAEEEGLIGADYFVKNPTVSRSRLVANVNLDMPILTYGFRDVAVLGGERSTIGLAAERAAARVGVRVAPAPAALQGDFMRSAQYRFVEAGIPAVLLRAGYANGGEAASASFLSSCYHAVCDDMSLPIDFSAAARFARLNYEIVREIADGTDRPRWYPRKAPGTVSEAITTGSAAPAPPG